MNDDEIRSEAIDAYYRDDGSVEITEAAPINREPADGYWVQAWVWVPEGRRLDSLMG